MSRTEKFAHQRRHPKRNPVHSGWERVRVNGNFHGQKRCWTEAANGGVPSYNATFGTGAAGPPCVLPSGLCQGTQPPFPQTKGLQSRDSTYPLPYEGLQKWLQKVVSWARPTQHNIGAGCIPSLTQTDKGRRTAPIIGIGIAELPMC